MSLSRPRDWEGSDDGDEGSRRSPPAKRPRCCCRCQDTRDFYERQMELLKKEMGCMSQGHQEKLESMSREIGATRDFYERQMELLKKEMRCISQGHKEGLESIRREMQDFYQKIYPQFSEMSECNQRKQQDRVALMAEISTAGGYVQQSPGSRISSNQNCIITLRLQFENSCSTDKYSTHEIKADDGTPLKVAIYDSNNSIITYEPFSSMRVHIVAIHGDFDDDHKGQWTEDYLCSNIVPGRPRKHILSGEQYFRLRNGVGYLNGVKFQDNSSFIPSKKFKLAVMADDQRITERIQEGITESFAVKDVRGYRYNTVMALWAGTGQAATVAQLVRADAGEVISMIIQAAGTARQNKKECEQLARRVFMIAELLPHLQDPEVMRREEVRRPLIGLGDTLREAHELVTSCQGRSAMYQFVTAGRQADRFRDVQSRIDSYLLVFPFISHIDITRRLDRIYNILLPNGVPSAAGSQSQLEAAEVAQEVVPLPHGVGAKEFTFAELAAATNNFALDTVISEGDFTTVYKGRLHDGREVAIKRMTTFSQGVATVFRKEMAILSPLRHNHIARLFGWSVQEEERLLVYEYMNNGTLHDHLHRQTSSSSPVMTSWRMRIEILLGVSRAIEHLHYYAVLPVIHCDIKSSNVLLDASWVPRLSDFGVSITYDEADEAEVPICGTLGYIDPEYAQTGRLKPTSDVYSFGVVMLEVLTGKKAIINWEEEESKPSVPRTRSRMSLPIFALQSIEAGELGKVLDRRPAVPEPTPRQLEAAELVARTAASCLRLRGEDRPAMPDVVADLETALELVRCGE